MSVFNYKPEPGEERGRAFRQASNLRLSYVAVIQDLQEEHVEIPPPVQEGLYRAEDIMRNLEAQRYTADMRKKIGPGQASPL